MAIFVAGKGTLSWKGFGTCGTFKGLLITMNGSQVPLLTVTVCKRFVAEVAFITLGLGLSGRGWRWRIGLIGLIGGDDCGCGSVVVVSYGLYVNCSRGNTTSRHQVMVIAGSQVRRLDIHIDMLGMLRKCLKSLLLIHFVEGKLGVWVVWFQERYKCDNIFFIQFKPRVPLRVLKIKQDSQSIY